MQLSHKQSIEALNKLAKITGINIKPEKMILPNGKVIIVGKKSK